MPTNIAPMPTQNPWAWALMGVGVGVGAQCWSLFHVHCAHSIGNGWAPCQWHQNPPFFCRRCKRFASVTSLHLSIRFLLQDSTIWVSREIYDNATFLLSLSMREDPRVADNDSSRWKLCTGKYRVYGLLDPSMNVYTEFRTPPHSSTSTLNTPPLVKVKIEPGIHTVIHLSDFSDGDEPLVYLPFTKHPHPSSVSPLLPDSGVSSSSIPCQTPMAQSHVPICA